MRLEIESTSGFCFGVKNAVKKAEEILQSEEKLFCLGDIVHNGKEIERLKKLGLITIGYEQFGKLKNCKVLLRAHGEPPSTYSIAEKNNLELIDASCPIVLNLQKKIKISSISSEIKKQIVIFGKPTHPEVISLVGQTNGQAVVVSNLADVEKIDFTREISLFSQTTMDTGKFKEITNEIKKRQSTNNVLQVTNSICVAVSGREAKLVEFSRKHETIIFIGGKKSSNGKMLFEICKKENQNSFYISNIEELKPERIINSESIGICGATSTPYWQLEKVAKKVLELTA
ncbi:MAG: 4-hydroxy-3-methylbut-2-enyl diphosphate reductase [Bacteroidota bacterium]|nr:4-hydroxy-3-methylbut-2-enyl diphosphate reductase [Bacteroidota bacterium]